MSPFRVTPADEQAWNEASLEAPVAAPAVRVWLYARSEIVLGRGQRIDGEMEARARTASVPVCGRITGGGAVLAGPWLLGASVVLPPEHRLVIRDLRRSYGWLGRAHARWLAALGIETRIAERADDRGLRWACFGGISYGELEVGARKIVGLAQARRRNGVVLSAGTLLRATPWDVLASVLGQPADAAQALAQTTTSCMEALGRPLPPDEELASSLQAILREACA